jgi:hypothetical protein
MTYIVAFENHPVVPIDSSFPSLAARLVAERLNLDGDRTCSVTESDGDVTHWKVTRVALWFSRPLITEEYTQRAVGKGEGT